MSCCLSKATAIATFAIRLYLLLIVHVKFVGKDMDVNEHERLSNLTFCDLFLF